jgi:heme-degrading monooxygenase HmoA
MSESEPTYVSTTIWKDRPSFDGWRKGSTFQQTHGGNKNKEDGGEECKLLEPLWNKPPIPVFYQGTLVISSKEGV